MKKPFDCLIGLREANTGSGVGLFNRLLAEKLDIPYVLLEHYALSATHHPLFSLKFEELDAVARERLFHYAVRRNPAGVYSLFLHALDDSDLENAAIRGAARVYCGNDAIYEKLRGRGASNLLKSFAPSLIPQEYQDSCKPGELEFFSFGMAGKVDCDRFLRLHHLLAETGLDYKLLCSLAVHQTSDGKCLSNAVDFFTRNFQDRFVYLGTLTDMGVAYFLNRNMVFVGFYRGGVRSNNTTFNTALRFHKKIISNLDAYSPIEVRENARILNIDRADAATLRKFLERPARPGEEHADLFSWEQLVRQMLEPALETGPCSWKCVA